MHQRHHRPSQPGKELPTVQMPIRHGKEDKPKEAIKRGAQQTQEIAHGGDHLGKDKPNHPNRGHDPDPHSPPDHRVTVRMARSAHQPPIHKLGADVGVNHANHQRGDNHKGERGLFVGDDAQTAKGGRGGVLPQVAEPDGGRDDEEEGRDAGEYGEGFWEILGLFHLCDKSRKQNLRDPEEGDVQDGVHGGDKGGAGRGEGVGLYRPGGGVVAIVAVAWVGLDAGKDEEEEDGDAHAGGGEHGHEGDVLEGAGDGHDDAHERGNDGKDNGALAVVAEGVEHFCTGEDVEADEHDVVGEQHESRELVGDIALAKGVVAKVDNVLDLGVLHDELVHGERGDVKEQAGDDHGDDTGHPAEDGEGPGLGHDGEADLVAGEQPRGFLPGHGAEFDFMLVVFGDEGSEGRDGTFIVRVDADIDGVFPIVFEIHGGEGGTRLMCR